MTGILNPAEKAAVTNDPTHVEFIKDSSEASMDDENLLYEVQMNPGKGVLFVILSDVNSNEMAGDYSVLGWVRPLPRGDMEIWLRRMEPNSIFQMIEMV
jgi:hypothetical protein